jgi:hypothetical protein
VLALQLKSVEWGRGAVPEPDKLAVVGEFVAVLTKETDPELVPLTDGANDTVTGSVVPAAMVTGKVRPVTLKPDPVTLAAERVTDPVPVFERVSV